MTHGVLSETLRASRFLRNGQLLQNPEELTAQWQCKKRDGTEVQFKAQKIRNALTKCFLSIGAVQAEAAPIVEEITRSVVNTLAAQKKTKPDVEEVQRLVIQQLWAEGLFDAAEHYQNYREARRKERETRPIPADVTARVNEDSRHFPTPIQYYQFIAKFARWQEEEKRRETWREACTRVMTWFRGLPKVSLFEQEWAELDASLYNMETCCAMRVVQMAGPALERCHVGAYNCLRRDTKFITRGGVKSFEDFKDGDRTMVLTHTGSWRMATVRCYGTDTVYPVLLGRGRTRHTVYATANHRWIHRDGSVTNGVQKGDILWKAPMPAANWDYANAEPFEKLAWCYGYVYGDGTLVKKNGEYRYSAVRLCGQDAVKYAERFEEMGFATSAPLSFSGDLMAYTGSYLKTLPSVDEKIEYLRAFVRGWLDADASKQTCKTAVNEFSCMQVTGQEGVDFVRRVFPVVGVYISREEDLTGQVTNYGPRSDVTIRFGLLNNSGDKHNAHFSALEVGEEGQVTDVWCLEVDKDQSFVLPGGVVTGNCAYLPLDSLRSFAELLYVLMSGSGCGFSVEDHYISQLPRVAKQTGVKHTHIVEDSTEGWCDALLLGLERWFAGEDVWFDVTGVRPAGTRLKTKGGRASGPEPLLALLAFARKLITSRQGKVLTDIDCHDLACMIGKIVQVGGVRRAATISISDLESQAMREAKSGTWYERARHRTMANNSAAYDGRPDINTFMAEFSALIRSESGERGIFNRAALNSCMPPRRKRGYLMGMNPCGEILLRAYQFCNLSIVVARPWDTEETLMRKVRLAAYWGCMQKTATNFRYLREEWKKNCEEEALLGVDITGHADCPLLRFGAPGRAELLRKLQKVVEETDVQLSARFNVNRSAANTCVKPSGDSSVLFNCASGCSPWFADCIMRWVREPVTSPVSDLLKSEGVPYAVAPEDAALYVFGFPRRAPAGATTRTQMSALDQLNNWMEWKESWAEHSVACTVYVNEDEWPDVMAWCYKNFDRISGLSFLPRDNGIYTYAPNEELTEEQYLQATAKFPTINWAKLQQFEQEDMTTSAQTYACVGGACELA